MSAGSYRIICILLLPFLVCACKHKIDGIADPTNGNTGGGTLPPAPPTPCDPAKIYFQQQVLPIFISNCTMSGCHDVASHQKGIILTSYEKIMSTADIRPGDPGHGKVWESINETDPDDRMPRPPMAPLTQQQKQIIYQWIVQGAQNLSCQNMCDSNSFTYSGAIKSLISNKCQGCHSGTAASGGIDLSTYNGLKAKVIDGRLWGAINHQPGFSPMPKNGAKLSDCEITQIKKWIDAGASNN